MTGLFVLSAAIVLAALILTLMNRPRILTARTRRAVMVTLKSGASFKGVLTDADAHALVLKGAEAVGAEVVPVDGELIVLRADVDYMQLP